MGWEMLPPEQPVWVSRCCPDECVKERDELRRRCESYKSAYDAILADLKIMEKKLSDLEAERDRLTDRIKELEDALAEEIGLSTRLKANLLSLLRAIEVKEIDDLMTKNEEHFKKRGEVIKDSIVEKIMEINRLTRLGEERHIRAKDTEKCLMEHVERLQAENERLLRCLADYPAGNQTEPDVKAALRMKEVMSIEEKD